MSKMFSKRLSELQRAPALQEVAGEVLEGTAPSLWGAQAAFLTPLQSQHLLSVQGKGFLQRVDLGVPEELTG